MDTFIYVLDLIGKILLVLIISPWGWILIAHGFAYLNIFFTNVKEGEAKAITFSSQFSKAVMSYTDYAFRWEVFDKGQTVGYTSKEMAWAKGDMAKEKKMTGVISDEDAIMWLKEKDGEPHDWDVIRLGAEPDALKIKRGRFFRQLPFGLGGLIGGLRWVGIIPGLWSIHKFRFAWASVEFSVRDGKPTDEKVIVPREEPAHTTVFVKRDVYGVVLKSAQTEEAIPVDIVAILTIAIRNPYKALFRIDHWFESVSNKVQASLREIIGNMTYKQIYGSGKGKKVALEEALKKKLREHFRDMRVSFGVQIDGVQVFSVEPTRESDRDLTLLPYKAKVEAEALREIAGAQKDQAQQVLREIATFGGERAVEAHLLAGEKSRLTTLVQSGSAGGGAMLAISPSPAPLPDPPPVPAPVEPENTTRPLTRKGRGKKRQEDEPVEKGNEKEEGGLE